MHQLEAIQQIVVSGDLDQVKTQLEDTLANGYSAEDILYKALMPSMDIVGERMARGDVYIPEVLLSAKVMQEGVAILKPMLGESKRPEAGKVLIGTVQGDVHDIGKNIVILMLECAGFNVIDLGINVPVQKFILAAKSEKPDILGMSAMLTTTMLEMGKVIDALHASGLRQSTKVMVGGAPLRHEWAMQIGADAYCADCAVAVKKANEFCHLT